MSQPIIQIQDVTMRFRMSNDRIMSLKEFVTTALRGKLKYKEFEALKHVSFTVIAAKPWELSDETVPARAQC